MVCSDAWDAARESREAVLKATHLTDEKVRQDGFGSRVSSSAHDSHVLSLTLIIRLLDLSAGCLLLLTRILKDPRYT